MDFLPALAASRQEGSGSSPITVLQRRRDELGGSLQITLTHAAADSSGPISQLLLSAFVEATTSAARSRAGQHGGLLPRGVQVTVLGGRAEAGDGPAGGGTGDCGSSIEQQQEQASLRVQFTATEPAAEEQVEQAARLFEAYWQFHVKAAKSDLHCRMRQRLGVLRQQLMLARLDCS